MADPFVIVGAGAIGGIVGAHLMRAGHAVVFVEANAEHAAAIRTGGLRLTGAAEFTVRPEVFAPEDFDRPARRVLLAVKSRGTEAALEPIADRLTDDGYVVSLQNGLEEEKIAARVGAERTIGAYLTFGGHYAGPGHIHFGGPASFKVGELDGRMTDRLLALSDALSALQPVEATPNIFGCLWAKMALGSVYFATATVDAAVLEIYADARAREVLGALAGETVTVAEAAGVATEACDGFDPKLFRLGAPRDEAAIAAAWEAQRGYWSRLGPDGRTGVWRDLAVHKRKTEIDWQAGAIIRAAEKHGVDVPRLRRLKRVVEEIEAGTRQQAWANLDALA